MVKRRTPKQEPSASTQPSAEQIEAFAAGADGGNEEVTQSEALLDPNAPRNYKQMRFPFNEYEYKQLEAAARCAGRTKSGFIRWAILEMSKQVQKDSE